MPNCIKFYFYIVLLPSRSSFILLVEVSILWVQEYETWDAYSRKYFLTDFNNVIYARRIRSMLLIFVYLISLCLLVIVSLICMIFRLGNLQLSVELTCKLEAFSFEFRYDVNYLKSKHRIVVSGFMGLLDSLSIKLLM